MNENHASIATCIFDIFQTLNEDFKHRRMKGPEECINMQDIRAGIDDLDKTIIQLIGRRYKYVQAAAKFKSSETSVKAPERVAAMLLQRRAWAEEEGLDPDVIAKIYSDLVTYFIAQELKHWKAG
jgi:isochorismate pyruvate lyase